MAVGQVLGIGAIFWFKDLASKQIRAAQKELLSLQKTATFSTKTMLAPMGLVQMGKGLKTMAIGAGMLSPLLAAIPTASFEEKLWRAGNVLEVSSGKMAQFREDVFKLAEKTPFSPENLAEGLYELGSAGLSYSEAMSSIVSVMKFGRLANIGYKESVNMVQKGLKAFGWGVEDTSKLLDRFVNLEKQSLIHYEQMPYFIQRIANIKASNPGVGAEEAMAVALTTLNMGMEPRRAGTTANQFFSALNKGLYSNRAVKEMMGAGIKFDMFDKQGNLLPFIDRLANLDKGVKQYASIAKDTKGKPLSADQQKVLISRIYADIFKRNAEAIPKIIESGKYEGLTGYDALAKQIEDLTRPRSAGQLASLEKLPGYQMSIVMNQFNVALKRFGEAILPQTVKLVQDYLGSLASFAKFVTKHPQLTSNTMHLVTTLGVMSIMFGFLRTTCGGLLFVIGNLLPALGALNAPVTGFRGLLAVLSGAGGGLVGGGLILTIGFTVDRLIVLGKTLWDLHKATKEVTKSQENYMLSLSNRVGRFNKLYGTNFTEEDKFKVDFISRSMYGIEQLISSPKWKEMSEGQRREAITKIALERANKLTPYDVLNKEIESKKDWLEYKQAIESIKEFVGTQQYIDAMNKILERVNPEQKINISLYIDGKQIRDAIANVEEKETERRGKEKESAKGIPMKRAYAM